MKTITDAKAVEAVKYAEYVGVATCSGLAFNVPKEFATNWIGESLQRADVCRQPAYICISHGGALVMCGVPSTDQGALEVVP